MKASRKIKELIKEFEGFCPQAYRCPAGVWTIGYGHTQGVRQGDKISRQYADELFEKDIADFERQLAPVVDGLDLRQCQYDALLSFAYNLGVGALKSSTLLKKVKANPDDRAIAAEFARWVNAGGKKLPGLVRRREREAKIYFGEA